MCSMCTRRSLICGAMTAFVLGSHGVNAAGGATPIVCGFNNEELLNYRSTMTSRSGDSAFDVALIAELRRILQVFPIDPGFKYVKMANAAATKETIVEGTQGTVFIGIDFVKALATQDDGGISVAAVLAHECAHIFQYFSPYAARLSGPTYIFMELHADVLAGYYLATKLGSATTGLNGVQRNFLQSATYNVSDPRHHGTPGQRNAALDKGYMLSRNGMRFEQAAREGERYVQTL
jgi:hypothetical protein